jgi:hypothetical protein
MIDKNIDHLSWNYRKQGIGLVGALFLMGLLLINLLHLENILTAIITSTVYGLIIEFADGLVWGKVARKAADNLTNFFMGVSIVRILSALLMILIYYMIAGRAAMFDFLVVFACFYLAIILHHTLFFRKHADVGSVN